MRHTIEQFLIYFAKVDWERRLVVLQKFEQIQYAGSSRILNLEVERKREWIGTEGLIMGS